MDRRTLLGAGVGLLGGAAVGFPAGWYGRKAVVAANEAAGRPNPAIKIAVVADIHHSREDVGTKLCTQAMGLMDEVVAWSNAIKPDIFVDLGDIIQEVSHEVDLQLAAEAKAKFDMLDVRHEHICGNHDIRNLSIGEWEALFGPRSFRSRSLDVNGFHLVFFSPWYVNGGFGPFPFDEDELAWLDGDLNRTDLPSIIFTHVPIAAGSLMGNGYFEGSLNGEAQDSEYLRRVIREHPTLLVVQGHTHWNALHVEHDVAYVTVPSLTEQRRTMPHPSAAATLIEVFEDRISIVVNGRDHATYDLRRRAGASVWA